MIKFAETLLALGLLLFCIFVFLLAVVRIITMIAYSFDLVSFLVSIFLVFITIIIGSLSIYLLTYGD